MTRYRVPVADPLLEQAEAWRLVAGFRLISVDGPWLAHPHVTICTFEDDSAPPEFEGRLIEPVFHQDERGSVSIIGRQMVTERA